MKNIKTLLIISLLFTVNSFAQKKWTLEECVAHAIENNVSVKQIELDNKLAEIDIKDAFGNFLPNLNATA